jgi:hypothetical protein
VEIVETIRQGVALAALADATPDRHLAEVRDGWRWSGLAPDGVHEIPPLRQDLPIPPAAGAKWTLTGREHVLPRCRVESISDVDTFAGRRAGCAVVVVMRTWDDTRANERIWYDPELGVVRAEGLSPVRWGFALCDESPPTEAAIVAMFPAGAPRR